MTAPRLSDSLPPTEAGSEQAWRPSTGLLSVAVGIVCAGLTYFWLSPDLPTEPAPPMAAPAPIPSTVPGSAPKNTPQDAVAAVPATRIAPPTAAPATPADGQDPTPDLSSYVNRGETPTMQEVITRLHQANVQTGLAAFSPPGTRPPRIGLAVPEDLVLPPGYVRHHQATDDGQRIEAILMFAPDYQPLDGNNQPMELPKDRVVPPHLAPPGFPIRNIAIPTPRAQQ